MSNQRKKGKSCKSVWMTQAERKMLAQIREVGCFKNDGDAIKAAIEMLAKKEGIKIDE